MSLPTYRNPFPSSIISADGCFALETDPTINASLSQTDEHAPILYRTKLHTRRTCQELREMGVRLDKECHALTRDSAPSSSDPPPCPVDNAVTHIGRPVCDFYEGLAGSPTGFYLAECDCLNRDNVPPLDAVVALCRDKADHLRELSEAYNAQIAAGADPATLTRPNVTVDRAMCDKLAAGEEVRMYPIYDRDLFTHTLSRYLVRASYRDGVITKLADPSLALDPASGYHAACTMPACEIPESTIRHVPYSATVTALASCKVSQCRAQISTAGAGGTVTIADNLFRVSCRGGENCSASAFTSPCGHHGACQVDGSCECDVGWTGERCDVETNPEDTVSAPDIPEDITAPDLPPPPSAPTTTTTTTVTEEGEPETSDAKSVPGWMLALLVAVGVVAVVIMVSLFGPE
jgi:hypothetical protein